MRPLRIGTRGSALALWQARTVAGLIALALGAIFLFQNAPSPYHTSKPLVITTAVVLGSVWAFAVGKAWQVRHTPVAVAPELIAGAVGEVRQDGLVFVNGDSAAEMAWATSQYSDLKAKIILVNGSPIKEMTARKRRFYFDQEGRLTAKLGIRHTPAIAVQDGRVMKLSEIKLKGNS